MQLNRTSYGSSFNSLTISDDGKRIIKKWLNDHGKMRMQNEIAFYKFAENIGFPIPTIFNLDDTEGIVLEYLADYTPLYKVFDKKKHLPLVYSALDRLHQHSYIKPANLMDDLRYEVRDKVLERYQSIRDIVETKYNSIKYVNDIQIMSFEEIVDTIWNRISKEYDLSNYKYHPIHGDCQFNNILINGDDIRFIDPRGYFGHSKIYGLKEYDYAKVAFALSGYDEFDNRIVDGKLQIIDEDKVKVKIEMLEPTILDSQSFINDLVIAIWLGNAHCFRANEAKMMTSYFIALYLGTKYLKKTLE